MGTWDRYYECSSFVPDCMLIVQNHTPTEGPCAADLYQINPIMIANYLVTVFLASSYGG